jgi:CDP-6-deoxy-D-xylo-4-hexulose-3-dehydrase
MFFPIIVDRRDELMIYLEKRGIQTRTMMPLTTQPTVKPYLRKIYPIADYINEYGLLLGCHQYLTKKELDHIVDSIWSFYEQ